MPTLKDAIRTAAVILTGLAVVVFLSKHIENTRPLLPDGYGDSDLTLNGSHLKGFTFGMDGLLADWYYMRALQYVGEKIINSKSENINIDDLSDLNPRLLYPLLNNATDLDPHFIEAYLYGAIVLPAIDPQKAIAIAEKGVANNPAEWRLYRPLGYIYWKLGQYEKASEIYEKGSEIEGAPPFMKLMAAAMKTKGGSRETARAIYEEMYNNTSEESVRITAQRRLVEIDILDEREAIDNVLTEWKQENGSCAGSFGEILPKLLAVKLPGNHDFHVDKARNLLDPTGTPYVLDREKCQVQPDPTKVTIVTQ